MSVLPDFFIALDTAPTSFKLGNSMQQFLDAFRIINGIAFQDGETRTFMYKTVNILPSYQKMVKSTNYGISTVPLISEFILLDELVEVTIPKISKYEFGESGNKVGNKVMEINISFKEKTAAVLASPASPASPAKVTYEISNTSRPIYDSAATTLQNDPIPFDVYVMNVKAGLRNLLELDLEVFELYTNKLSNLKGMSMPNDTHKIYDMSLFDILMSFVDSDSSVSYSADSTLTNVREIDVFNNLNNINNFFKSMKVDGADDFNQMIIKINEKQMDIQSHKDSIKKVKEKVYTLLSRDKNYTNVLSYKRRQFYITLVLLLIISSIYGYVLLDETNINLDLKNYIVGSVAVGIFVIQILVQLLGMIKQSRIKENFNETVSPSFDKTFEYPLFVGAETLSTTGNVIISYVLVNFVDKYNENMTYEVKSEYYESITSKQEQDAKMLEQLHKENENQKHLHQLKNSLTYFKINATREYNSYVNNGVVLVSVLAILYLSVLNKILDYNIFVIGGSALIVLYVTFVLLSVKSIMLRDKYDWDRFNWTLHNVKSNSNSERCTLPGR
jgi:hypothetical protein